MLMRPQTKYQNIQILYRIPTAMLSSIRKDARPGNLLYGRLYTGAKTPIRAEMPIPAEIE